MTAWVVVVAILAAEPGAGPPVDSRIAWVNLAPTIVALSARNALIAAGVELPITERLSLTFEAAGHFGGPWIYDCATSATGGWLSAGLTVRPLERFRGFFVQPKVNFHEAYSSGPSNMSVTDGCFRGPYPNGFDFDGGVGVTVGWDWVVLDHLYLGSAIGGSLNFGKTLSGAIRFAQLGPVEVMAHVDLSLLRVGYAW